MKNISYCNSLLATLLLVCGSTSIANAGSITTFSDRSNFNTAVGATPLTIEDFTDTSHFPISTGILNSQTNLVVDFGSPIEPGDIEPGVTYSTPIGTNYSFNIDALAGFDGGFLDGFFGGDPNRVLTVDFDNNISAFGFDTNYTMGSDFNLTIKFTSGPDFVQNFSTTNSADLGFFGFQSSAADIQTAVIDGNGNGTFAFAVDNFTFTAVPEPNSAVSVLAFGAFGTCLLLKRKQRQQN